jgi:hypothetical protein
MINLWYENAYSPGIVRGPVKVITNTIRALEECDINFSLNFERYEYNFFLPWNPEYYGIYSKLKSKKKFLVGPQIWPLSREFSLLSEEDTIVVPSNWVKHLFEEKFNVSSKRILIWPCPIYAPSISYTPTIDCLIYFKNRSQEDLSKVKNFLDKKNITHIQLSYDHYDQSDFINALSSVKFCVILDNTESQGVAIQEMMSVNKPLFVWDQPIWDHQGDQYAVPATSVPYWSEKCGKKFTDFNNIETYFEEFSDNFDNYSPSEFVDEKLSPQKSVNIVLEHYSK